MQELDVILDQLSDPVPFSPKKQKRASSDAPSSVANVDKAEDAASSSTETPEQSRERALLTELYNRSVDMVLCQNLLGTEAVQSNLETPPVLDEHEDLGKHSAETIIGDLIRLSRAQHQNLDRLSFLTRIHKAPEQVPKHLFKQEPVFLALWQKICETNTAIKNHTAQLFYMRLNETPSHTSATKLHWYVESPTTVVTTASTDEEESSPSPEKQPSEEKKLRSSPRRKRQQLSVTLSPDEKKEILKKTHNLLKEAFPKRDRPYSGRMVQGRMYEIVVQLALQKTYGETSVCDTNSVRANFPVFDLLWKEGDTKRFVSLKCHLTESAKERVSQINRDKCMSDRKLEDRPELLATAIYKHYQHLKDYLSSPVKRAAQRLQLCSPDSPTYFDRCESLYMDISDDATESQRFIVTRSTLKEAIRQDNVTAKNLAAINFSTKEFKDFMDSLKEDIPVKWESGSREAYDPAFDPEAPDHRPVSKAKRRLSFSDPT